MKKPWAYDHMGGAWHFDKAESTVRTYDEANVVSLCGQKFLAFSFAATEEDDKDGPKLGPRTICDKICIDCAEYLASLRELKRWNRTNQGREAGLKADLAKLQEEIKILSADQQESIMKMAKQIQDNAWRAGMDEVQFGHGY